MFPRKIRPKGNTLIPVTPQLQGRNYDPGIQIYSPGESAYPNRAYPHPIPWPNAVPTLNVLLTFSGVARDQPIQAENNRYSTLPEKWLYIAGFIGKSKG